VLPDESVVELPLVTPVEPGATIEVAFKFTAQLPEVFARTGYKGDFHMVAQWFPKIGVRTGTPGAEHWECRPHHAFSEFFADFGTYDVVLTAPSTYVVAATGVLTAVAEAAGGTRTYSYRAEDVHDFVIYSACGPEESAHADPVATLSWTSSGSTFTKTFVPMARVEGGDVVGLLDPAPRTRQRSARATAAE